MRGGVLSSHGKHGNTQKIFKGTHYLRAHGKHGNTQKDFGGAYAPLTVGTIKINSYGRREMVT